MALYPALLGHVDLPLPEPLQRRADRQVAQQAGIRLVRQGEQIRGGSRSSQNAS